AVDSSWSGRGCRSALIVTDEHLASLGLIPGYRDTLTRIGIEPSVAVLPPGEATKSLAVASRLYDELVSLKADRHTAVVAIGGGVVGDPGGFVAATSSRG